MTTPTPTRRGFVVVAVTTSLLFAGCNKELHQPAARSVESPPIEKAAAPLEQKITHVATALAGDGSDGSWASYGRGFDATHYSPLTEINDGNVDKLGLAWAVDLPVGPSHSAPLAVDGAIYFSRGSTELVAVDAVTGKLKWKYDTKAAEVAGDKMRMAWGTRGIGFWNNKLYVGTLDGRLLAINADNGTLAWSVDTTIGRGDGRYITGAPLLFDGKVLIGHGGADTAAVRGYVTAYDAQTGKKVWRFYTVPGNPSAGPDGEASDAVMAMAAKTWKGEWWKHGGGGTVWNAMAYDIELDRVYIGTGNGAPWNQAIRSPGGGDNLFLCSIVALDAKTGKYIWHYQLNPGETWDFNAAMDIELATLDIGGKPTKVLLHAPKNGFFYVIHRESGKFISGIQWAHQNWAKNIDKDGRPVELPNARPTTDGQLLINFPGGFGAHNWMPMSFSPKTGLVYIPRQDMPFAYSMHGIDTKTWHASERSGYAVGYAVPDTRQLPPASKNPLGALVAWNPVAGKEAWSVPMKAPSNGGTLATGGNLVFQGNAEGNFVAYAADTGKVLWSFDAHNGITGQPITFTAGGKQYVSLLTGYGGTGAVVGHDAAKFNWQYRQQHRRLLTFALGGTARLPDNEAIPPLTFVDDPNMKLDDKEVEKGSLAFVACFACHGPGAVAGGNAPDLRASPLALSAENFKAVVQGGQLEKLGMPKFDELSDEQVEQIRTFIRFRAREALREQKALATN